MEEKANSIVKHVSYNKYLKEALEQIPKGAFLSLRKDDIINTMTIGWASVGIMWGREVLVIGVRPSRFSYSLIDLTSEFTVSIPVNQQMKTQLTYYGTTSGKDVDKYKECDITLLDGQKVQVPVIGECGIHYECKVVARHGLVPEYMDETIKARYYPEGDYHMIYYGEILDCYTIV